MRRIVPVLIAAVFVPTAAQAAAAFHSAPEATSAKRVNLRIVDDRLDPRPRPIRQSGMIAQTQLLPNTTVGFGILKVSKSKVGSPDWRIDSRGGSSKRPAVTFEFRF